MKPKYVKEALLALPSTLDETYRRILIGIDQMFQKEASVLLQWLAYAQSPPTLGELAEASVINVADEGTVDIDNRGSFKDTLEILSGLVVCGQAEIDRDNGDDEIGFEAGDSEASGNDASDEEGDDENEDSESDPSSSIDDDDIRPRQKIGKGSRVRLAHFSVQEYLESKRIIQSPAQAFSLESTAGHIFLAQSCLTCIMHYSSSNEKTSSAQDLQRFPLLEYTAKSWYYHSWSGGSGDVSRETDLLESEDAKRNWLLVHQPDRVWEDRFGDLDDM